MKKLTIILCLLIFAGSAVAQTTSAMQENLPPTQMVDPINKLVRNDGCNFLVFMDNLPWGSAAIQTILTNNGESFVVLNSSAMATEDFSQYDVIIIASDQVPGFHANFVANFTKFVNWVTAGGRLQVHAATCGWNSPCGYSVQLPGGVFTTEHYDNYNVIADAAHPIVAGISNPFYGTYASHGEFSNLVPGTSIITVSQINGNPTTIQYNYGSGTVTATTCTYEFGYFFGQAAGQMLVNNLNYSCSGFVPPVPVSNWALYVGILLILTFVVIRFRRMI